jgi:hypothetical protein
VVVIGAWLIALIVLSVFMPSLVRSLVSNAAMAAGATVLIVWGLWYLLFIFPTSPFSEALRQWCDERRMARVRGSASDSPSLLPPDQETTDESPIDVKGKEDE